MSLALLIAHRAARLAVPFRASLACRRRDGRQIPHFAQRESLAEVALQRLLELIHGCGDSRLPI